jgi:hypothetical protein
MRKRRVLRWLCSARLSGNSFLVVGTLVAILAPFVPLAGAALAPLIAAVAAILGVVLTASLVGALLGPVVW